MSRAIPPIDELFPVQSQPPSRDTSPQFRYFVNVSVVPIQRLHIILSLHFAEIADTNARYIDWILPVVSDPKKWETSSLGFFAKAFFHKHTITTMLIFENQEIMCIYTIKRNATNEASNKPKGILPKLI
jgi:hypothetical protein